MESSYSIGQQHHKAECAYAIDKWAAFRFSIAKSPCSTMRAAWILDLLLVSGASIKKRCEQILSKTFDQHKEGFSPL